MGQSQTESEETVEHTPVSVEEATDGGAKPGTAVLLTGYGGPDCLEAVAPFMRNLMGREPDPGLLDEVRRRYLAVGGCSPMLPMAQEIAIGLEQRLVERGRAVPVTFAMRYWQPFIGDAIKMMYDVGIRTVITVSLSPYESLIATGAVRSAIDEAVADLHDMKIVPTPLLHTMDAFSAVLAAQAATALFEIKDVTPRIAVFTAHSLPASEIEADDSYVTQLRGVLDNVIAGLQMPVRDELDGSDSRLPGVEAWGNLRDPQPWVFAFQSKGRKPGPWLGPDLDAVLKAAVAGGFAGVALCPIGFAVDNMETVFDLDVAAADYLVGQDIAYARSALPNDDPLLLDALAEVVEVLL